MARRPPWRRIRTATVLAITVVALGALLHGCPSFRDGMAGNLARAQGTCESATQAGIFALDLWRAGKSTRQLAAVQMTDARDEDLRLQPSLLDAMTDAVTALDGAAAAVRGVDTATPADVVLQRLSDAMSRLSAVTG